MQFPVLFPRIGMPLRWKSKSKQKSCPDRTALFMIFAGKITQKKGVKSLLRALNLLDYEKEKVYFLGMTKV